MLIMYVNFDFPIADVAVTKRHQWLDEIWINLTCTSGKKSVKLFLKKLCHATYTPDTERNPVCIVYICMLAIDANVSQSIHLL